MKKGIIYVLILSMTMALGACGNKHSNENVVNNNEEVTKDTQTLESKSDSENVKRVASDNSQMQIENTKIATRVIEGGTKINLYFGDVVIPGTLNDSSTAKNLISRLPYTVHVNRYSHDFCGVMDDPLKYTEDQTHYGWLNGDIDFATDANYFTILFEDEAASEQYGYQVNIGKIDCELSVISALKGSYDVRIELAK